MTDLTDRMRTCAARILADHAHERDDEDVLVYRDAADLLIEASNALEMVPEPLGEPMEILEPLPQAPPAPPPAPDTIGQWYGPGDILTRPPVGPPSPRLNRVCPQCDSRAAKRVYREGRLLMLACPVCATAWEYKP